jgi:plastocyanin
VISRSDASRNSHLSDGVVDRVSTAKSRRRPGAGEVPAEQLRNVIGVREVAVAPAHSLAVTDITPASGGSVMTNSTMLRLWIGTAGAMLLASASALSQQAAATKWAVENFKFVPATLTVTPGTAVTRSNHDEEPHNTGERLM